MKVGQAYVPILKAILIKYTGQYMESDPIGLGGVSIHLAMSAEIHSSVLAL
jgi:hypothetical protein